MKQVNYFLILILVILSFPVLGDDCESVNLVTKLGSPFLRMPVPNQGKLNICYAYTAAQMADYHLIRNGSLKRSIHAGWVALNYARTSAKKKIEIGHTKQALEELQRAGNCDFEAMASAWSKLSLETIRSSSLPELVGHVLTACPPEERKQFTLPQIRTYNYKQLPEDRAYTAFIQKRLDTKESPLSISYCSNIWKDKDYKGIELTNSGVRDRVRKDCRYHESLVVGKKMIGNRCHFLIRNSWGEKWSKENSGLACLCRNKNSGAFTEECRLSRHSDTEHTVEACWAPSTILEKNIGQVTVFE